MTNVPKPVQRFIDTTNQSDTTGFLACFAPEAVLVDWGSRYAGRDQIADWNQTDNIGVQSRFKIENGTLTGAEFHCQIAVSGKGFNGTGTMTFTLSGDVITQLVIS